MNYNDEVNKWIDGERVKYSLDQLIELYNLNQQSIWEDGYNSLEEAKKGNYTIDYDFFMDVIVPRVKRNKKKLLANKQDNIVCFVGSL